MKFQNYLKEVTWRRRQLRKGKPYWVYDKYEITKEPDGFKLVDVTQMTKNEPREIGRYESLKKAKEACASVCEPRESTDLSFIWEDEMKEAVSRYNVGFEEMVNFYQNADKRQIRQMEKLLQGKNNAETWHRFKSLINQVLGVKLK